jgi:hypothetical protein
MSRVGRDKCPEHPKILIHYLHMNKSSQEENKAKRLIMSDCGMGDSVILFYFWVLNFFLVIRRYLESLMTEFTKNC